MFHSRYILHGKFLRLILKLSHDCQTLTASKKFTVLVCNISSFVVSLNYISVVVANTTTLK